MTNGCPCAYGTPCVPHCTCAVPISATGCRRCCRYGSLAQRTERAKALIAREAERATFLGLIRRGYLTAQRTGWEAGQNTEEWTREALDVLRNAGIDPLAPIPQGGTGGQAETKGESP